MADAHVAIIARLVSRILRGQTTKKVFEVDQPLPFLSGLSPKVPTLLVCFADFDCLFHGVCKMRGYPRVLFLAVRAAGVIAFDDG